MNNMQQNVQDFETETKKMNDRMTKMGNEHEELEMYGRRNSVVIFGVDEEVV